MGSVYDDYGQLLERFIQRKMSVTEFQAAFMKLFKGERRQLDERVFATLDGLFGDIDAFCPDPDLRNRLEAGTPGFYLDEEQLVQRVTNASEQLRALHADSAGKSSPNKS